MNKETLRTELARAKEKSAIDYRQCIWELAEQSGNDKERLSIAEVYLESQVEELIKEWNKNDIKLDNNFKIKQKNYLLGERKLRIFDKEFLIEDFHSINNYLKDCGSHFFFYAGNFIIAGYYSELKGYDDVFLLDNFYVSKSVQSAPMIVIEKRKYIPDKIFPEFIRNVLSVILNRMYFDEPWKTFQQEFEKDIISVYGIKSSNDIPENPLIDDIPEKLLFNYIDLIRAHENGHINVRELYEDYSYILSIDNYHAQTINEYLADCMDGPNGYSTLGFIKETWKNNPEKAKHYLGLEISIRISWSTYWPDKDEFLKFLIKVYNSEIKIEDLQDNLKERLLGVTADIFGSTCNCWWDTDNINRVIHKCIPNRLLYGLYL